MAKFWEWFDNLSKEKGTLRFIIFITFSTLVLVGLPIIGKMGLGLDLASGQIAGVAILVILAISKQRK